MYKKIKHKQYNHPEAKSRLKDDESRFLARCGLVFGSPEKPQLLHTASEAKLSQHYFATTTFLIQYVTGIMISFSNLLGFFLIAAELIKLCTEPFYYLNFLKKIMYRLVLL